MSLKKCQKLIMVKINQFLTVLVIRMEVIELKHKIQIKNIYQQIIIDCAHKSHHHYK